MRAFLIRRNSISLAICGIAAVLMFYVVNYPAAVDASRPQGSCPFTASSGTRNWYPSASTQHGAMRTPRSSLTFWTASRSRPPSLWWATGVDKYPESVKALHDAGHEVMNHSNTHAHYPQLSPQAVVDDLNACNDKIEAVTGVRPTLVRLPYGDYDDNAIRAVRSIGMEPIQWDVDSLDWKELPAQEIRPAVTERSSPAPSFCSTTPPSTRRRPCHPS